MGGGSHLYEPIGPVVTRTFPKGHRRVVPLSLCHFCRRCTMLLRRPAIARRKTRSACLFEYDVVKGSFAPDSVGQCCLLVLVRWISWSRSSWEMERSRQSVFVLHGPRSHLDPTGDIRSVTGIVSERHENEAIVPLRSHAGDCTARCSFTLQKSVDHQCLQKTSVEIHSYHPGLKLSAVGSPSEMPLSGLSDKFGCPLLICLAKTLFLSPHRSQAPLQDSIPRFGEQHIERPRGKGEAIMQEERILVTLPTRSMSDGSEVLLLEQLLSFCWSIAGPVE